MKIKFTTWEKYRFDYLERMMKKKLSMVEKCALIIKMGWRENLVELKHNL